MGYIKMGQIQDTATSGADYLEDQFGTIINNTSPALPLDVKVEVIEWTSYEEWLIHGLIVDGGFHPETATVPDNTLSIRQHVYNQMVLIYPTLVI